MSYSPTNWVDGTTPVDASNLNKLEQAVSENSDSIGKLECQYFTSTSSLFNSLTDMNIGAGFLFRCSGTVTSFLSNGTATSAAVGAFINVGSNMVDFICATGSTNNFMWGRIYPESEELNYSYRITGTRVSN